MNTLENPANLSTKPTLLDALIQSCWFTRPAFLWNSHYVPTPHDASFCQDVLPEERPSMTPITTLATSSAKIGDLSTLSPLFDRVSDFNKLIRITMIILSWKSFVKSTPEVSVTRETAIKCLVRAAQRDCFQPLILSLSLSKELPKHSPLAQYSPMLDSERILRVGGRLAKADVPFDFKHPMLIPEHPLARSLVSHLHMKSKHQGGHITSAAIRHAGFYLIKGSSVVRRHIKGCCSCQKLRG